MAAIRKGNQWGFINQQGILAIDFRNDIYWHKDADIAKADISGIKYPIFKNGRCLITKNVEDGVPVFGYINTSGDVVIEPKFLNVYPFKDGYATGVLFTKTLKGENEFKLKVYEFKFFDVLFNTEGEIIEYFEKRDTIQMTKKRYKMPWIGSKILANVLIGIYIKDDKAWEIKNMGIKE